MKVLLSAYACEPGKGSEPGVGWKWAMGLAERVTLTVLTREDNRRTIETELSKLSENSPLRQVNFLHHDLSPLFLWAKRRGLLPTLAYYAIWQWSVSRKFAKVADESDVVHHLTFCTLLCPGFWRLKQAAFVLGPVGAPQVNQHYFPLFGNKAWIQRLRAWTMARFLKLPWLRRLLHRAGAVVPANSETQALLTSQGVATKEVMLDTGTPKACLPEKLEKEGVPLRLMYAGQLERRKGLELSLRALAQVSDKKGCEWSFDVFGSGPDRPRLAGMAVQLGIASHVHFHDPVPQADLKKHFANADAFLFTSVRDTSGGVNLEAMAHGLPLICIAHQGVGDITDDHCAARIPPGSIPDTIDRLAQAVIHLSENLALLRKMGVAAANRAREEFSWDDKFDRMCEHYREALGVTAAACHNEQSA
jgi:glycosyltransferase involved in cell wall biosynthesis